MVFWNVLQLLTWIASLSSSGVSCLVFILLQLRETVLKTMKTKDEEIEQNLQIIEKCQSFRSPFFVTGLAAYPPHPFDVQ